MGEEANARRCQEENWVSLNVCQNVLLFRSAFFRISQEKACTMVRFRRIVHDVCALAIWCGIICANMEACEARPYRLSAKGGNFDLSYDHKKS